MTTDHRPRHAPAPTRRVRAATVLTALMVVVASAATACLPVAATAQHTVTDQWSDGYAATLRLTNVGTSTLQDWQLELTLADELTEIWNAELTEQGPTTGGHRYRLQGPSWQPDLDPGASLDIGWVADIAGTAPGVPRDCLLGGRPITCTTTYPPSTTTAPTSTTTPSSTTPSTTTTPEPTAAMPFAPYLDTTLWPPADLDGIALAAGLDTFTLAFVVTGDAPCSPAWGGVIPLADDHLGAEIAQLRAAGGDVVISFGGANGIELAQSCPSVEALTDAYGAVISHYAVDRIDFDVEGGALADAAANVRRAEALAELQAEAGLEGRSLSISLTLPVLPTGLTPAGVELVRTTISAGVAIDVVNVMAMDYGDGSAPDPDGQMGRYAIDAAIATHRQLGLLMPASGDTERWRHIGLTPMIGQNDVASEVFGLPDAAEVAAFAADVGLGRLSMWSIARDRPCPGGPSPWASPTCSGVDHAPWAFAATLGGG